MPEILKAYVARQGYQKPPRRSIMSNGLPFIPEQNFFFKTFFRFLNRMFKTSIRPSAKARGDWERAAYRLLATLRRITA